MKSKSIFVLEDDLITIKLIKHTLEKYEYKPLIATDAYSAHEIINQKTFAAAILDLNLPDIYGMEVLKNIRAHPIHKSVPVIILTGNDDKTETIISLEMGADDYITKPFNSRELIARIKANLRRTSESLDSSLIVHGSLIIDSGKREVNVDGNVLHLTYNEFEILLLMASNPGIVMTRDALLNKIWGNDFSAETRTVDIHISSLRKKLSISAKNYIETVRGVGYRFVI